MERNDPSTTNTTHSFLNQTTFPGLAGIAICTTANAVLQRKGWGRLVQLRAEFRVLFNGMSGMTTFRTRKNMLWRWRMRFLFNALIVWQMGWTVPDGFILLRCLVASSILIFSTWSSGARGFSCFLQICFVLLFVLLLLVTWVWMKQMVCAFAKP